MRIAARSLYLVFISLAAYRGVAATFVWSGGATGGNTGAWSNTKNWGSSGPPGGTDQASFTNVVGNSSSPSIGTTATSVGEVLFTANAAAFNVSGTSTMTISGVGGIGIENDSTTAQTFSVSGISLGAPQSWVANSGDISFTGGTVAGGANLLTISGSHNITIGNVISGTGGLEKTGSGTLTLSGANTYSGAATIDAGTVMANSAGAAGTSSIVLNGGTLVLGANLNAGRPITLAGGALSANDRTVTFGALNVSASSTINLNADSTHGSITFASAALSAGVLNINNWSGQANTAGTDDHIFVTAQPSATFLNNVQFTGFPQGATWLNGTGELAPVPEPQFYGAVFALSLLAWSLVRRGFGCARTQPRQQRV
jgi:autotransporter-associated beta strand protein